MPDAPDQSELFAAPEKPRSTSGAAERLADEIATGELILDRQQHPAWVLLAARRAPLVIGCLKPLFDEAGGEIPIEDARVRLSELLAAHANDPDFEISSDEFPALARRELREWIRKGLLAERGGRIFATDALQSAFRFVESIRERIMTSTASRLATVQQRIESLEARMDPDVEKRKTYLRSKIAELEKELAEVEAGRFEVLEGARAAEEIREVYSLASSLRADFRRVEDSYREADRGLRQSIIRDENNRGQVVERLLATNEELLRTPEGQVFHAFYEQVARTNELDKMRHRIRRLLEFEACATALTPKQSAELRGLISRLVDESENVMRARARSEKDVRGFIKTGLAGEHHRVGKLLDELFETALGIDWNKQKVRRAPAPIRPVAPGQSQIPVPGRVACKSLEESEEVVLNLEQQRGALDELTESYRLHALELDRSALFERTLEWLKNNQGAHSVGKLAATLPPDYDLESIAFWLSLAREAGIAFPDTPDEESVDLAGSEHASATRFHFPRVALHAAAVAVVEKEVFE